MKKSNNVMTIIYELLDEIIGGLFPGIYFCTYFLLCAYVVLGRDVLSMFSSNSILIGIPFLGISYVLGRLFKRGNMERTDTLSVKYIMKRTKKNLVNNEYLSCTFSNYCDNELLADIENVTKKYNLHISLCYIKNKRRIWSSVESPNYIIFLYASKKIDRASRRVNKVCMILNPLILLSNNKSIRINKLLEKREALSKLNTKMREKIDLRVDYPYSHLKNYLAKNGLENLASYVDWDTSDGRKTKAFITEIVAQLNECDYKGMKYIKQRDAHIRFMNSAYHSQRSLFICATFVFFIVLSILTFRFFFLLSVGFEKNIIFTFKNEPFKFIVDKAFDYIVRIVDYENLFLILCISAVYMLFYIITRRFVLGNFHYQRIREIVFLLQAKDHVEKKCSKISKISKFHKKSNKKLYYCQYCEKHKGN